MQTCVHWVVGVGNIGQAGGLVDTVSPRVDVKFATSSNCGSRVQDPNRRSKGKSNRKSVCRVEEQKTNEGERARMLSHRGKNIIHKQQEQGARPHHRSWNALPSPSPSAFADISFCSAPATRLPKEIRRAGARAKLVARTRRRVRGGDKALGCRGDVGRSGGVPLACRDLVVPGRDVTGVCGCGNSAPRMLGLRWRLALGLGSDLVDTVVAAVLDVLAVVLELLLDEEPLQLFKEDFDGVEVVVFVSFGLARDLGVVGGGGVAVGEGVTVLVRSFFACFVLIFSSSSEEG
jgi:hypothetical protein